MVKLSYKEKTPEEKADWERKCKRDGILNKKYKSGGGVQSVTDKLKEQYNMSNEQARDAALSPDRADEILNKNNGVWKFSEQNFLTMSDLEKIELEYEEKKDVAD